MKLTVARPLLIDVYIKGRNRKPPVPAWSAPQKRRSSAGPMLLMRCGARLCTGRQARMAGAARTFGRLPPSGKRWSAGAVPRSWLLMSLI